MTKKGLFILCGECFREGMPNSRLRDTEYGLENQTQSSLSHVKLIEQLKSLKYEIDISINTYNTRNQQKLLDFYPNVVYKNFTDRTYSSWGDSVKHSILNTLSELNKDDYVFIFVCRLDLLLKKDFIYLFDPEWQEITYPNVMSIKDDRLSETCISDVFVFIPCAYFGTKGKWKGLLENAHIILHHHAVVDLIKNGLTLEDVGFTTDLIFIANTFQMKNPLYAINCRAEGPWFFDRPSGKKRYNKETHTVKDF